MQLIPKFAGMIYPKNFEQKIGFNQIREMVREFCISPMGREYLEKVRFMANPATVRKLLTQVSELKDILSKGSTFPARDFFDLRAELTRLATPGTYIDQQALFDLRSSLKTADSILTFFQKSPETAYPELNKLCNEVYLPAEIIPLADRIIDDKGEIRDSASEKLRDIRKQLKSKAKLAMAETRKAFEMAKRSGWAIENAEVTIRNGRAVIPLHASDKRSLGGIIHDESASGQTVFVEPSKTFEINNQIRELENEERREIIRILTGFADNIRPDIDSLIVIYRFLGLMDFIRAKAKLSIKLKASQPKISSDKSIFLTGAVHPQLFISHLVSRKLVVPLDLELNLQNRILVISGPNAGGKSVCLKTMGLVQYMLQCGFHTPCSPDSSLPIFEKIFIDIGDEQSLENDLSTYSSHLLNMKFFLQKANQNTLVLIDEFGAGTEPQLGGAIAEAALEQLNRKKAWGVVTTHYSNLKVTAQRTEGLINGAMLFDSEQMKPLYKLQIGNPGSSFAFEIARNIGFPDFVLNQAKKKTGGKHITFDEQLQRLEINKLNLEKEAEALRQKDEKLSAMVEKYTNLLEDIKRNKKTMLDKARQEAFEIVAGSNRAIENTIREIKEARAESSKTRAIRKKLEQKKQQIKAEVEESTDKAREVEREKEENSAGLKAGDFVKVKDTDIIGELVSIEGTDALLDVNEVKLKTSVKKLIKSKRKPSPPSRKKPAAGLTTDINQRAMNFSLSIDLRGKRADEALSLLGRYIDDASMLGIREVSILHGKGDGILRPIVREYLQTIDEIDNFGDAPLDQGGAGITKVYFA